MGHIWATKKKSDLGHFSLQCELSLSFQNEKTQHCLILYLMYYRFMNTIVYVIYL